MRPRPKPPFSSWPEHHYDPLFGHAWWCQDGVIVCQTDVQHASLDTVVAYHRFEAAMLERQKDALQAAGGLFVLQDWRTVAGYDSAARTYWQKQMQSRPRGYLRGAAVCLSRVAPLLRMAVQSANLVASLTRSGKVEVGEDIDAMVRALRPEPVARYVP